MELNKLAEQARKLLNIEIHFQDEKMKHLSVEKQIHWGSLLSSLAASENIENLILEPLILKYKSKPEIHSYLLVHSEDEVKHYRWLSTYVKENTSYIRGGRSISDIIFYDILLPRLSSLTEKKSYFLFALMYFYELFTLDFYKELIRAAEEDGLQSAEIIFQHIRQDEVRHCLAAKELLKEALRVEKFNSLEKLKIASILKVFQFDMATFFWCLHNKRVRKSSIGLGISPSRMWEMSSQAMRQTIRYIEEVKA